MTGPPQDPLEAVAALLAELAAKVDGLDGRVGAVETRLADPPQRPYRPAPTVPWWKLHGPERDPALARLRQWVREVYLPGPGGGYGHLGQMLPACWEQHDLCLYVLDWLIELWSGLYVPGPRTQRIVSGQAELTTRILPAAAALMRAEAGSCQHHRGGNGKPGPATARSTR